MTLREKLIKRILMLDEDKLMLILNDTCMYDWFNKRKPNCDYDCTTCWQKLYKQLEKESKQ